jgi:hypothetical protein
VEVEDFPDSDDDMGEDRGLTKASPSSTPLVAERLGSTSTPVDAGPDVRPFPQTPLRRCSVAIEDLVDIDAPPPLKRKASAPAQDEEKPPPWARTRSQFSEYFGQSSVPSPPATAGASILRTRTPTPNDDATSDDWVNDGEESGGVQPKLTGKGKKKKRKNDDRSKKRKAQRANEFDANTRRPRKKDVNLCVSKDKVIPTDVNIHTLPADSSGYGATYAKAADEEREVLNKEKLESEGFKVIEWDGRYVAPPFSGLALTFSHPGNRSCSKIRKPRSW